MKLGNDIDHLKAVRALVWEKRISSPLFDCKCYASNLEALFGAMWDKYGEGKGPDHLVEY